jgi:hypothetical protein
METSDDSSSLFEVFSQNGSRGLKTKRGFQKGEVICSIPCTAVHAEPGRYTVQTGPQTHIDVGGLTTLNHSCDPNLLLDTTHMLVIAARAISPGEELTFFYPSTEWDMAEPFDCQCNSPDCLGTISGAKHLSKKVLKRYYINPHILAMSQSTV